MNPRSVDEMFETSPSPQTHHNTRPLGFRPPIIRVSDLNNSLFYQDCQPNFPDFYTGYRPNGGYRGLHSEYWRTSARSGPWLMRVLTSELELSDNLTSGSARSGNWLSLGWQSDQIMNGSDYRDSDGRPVCWQQQRLDWRGWPQHCGDDMPVDGAHRLGLEVEPLEHDGECRANFNHRQRGTNTHARPGAERQIGVS